MLRCSSCLQVLPVQDFWWKHRTLGQRQEWCKTCRRAYRFANREREREPDRLRKARKAALNVASSGLPA
jgi:hypothetical protein